MSRLLGEWALVASGVFEGIAHEEDGVGQESTKLGRGNKDDEDVEEGLPSLLAQLGRRRGDRGRGKFCKAIGSVRLIRKAP